MNQTERKKVIISVISDLVTDQRVHRSALTLYTIGMDVILVGRRLKKSMPINDRLYQTVRFSLWFEKGFLFYASYNIRLFFFLLFTKADMYLSNDLDTLAANFLASKIKNVKLVYDSHEYFTEVPELINRPTIRSIWLSIEKFIFPKLKFVFTVNESIASLYNSKYKVPVKVVRNLPMKKDSTQPVIKRSEWNIPENKKIFLFQGAGINVDRGAEEAIEAITKVDAILLILGSGDVIDNLKKNVINRGLQQKVFFIPKQSFEELNRFTRMADIGLTLDKSNNLNYKYSLPNKLFDYIQARLPVLATDLVEVSNIVHKYDVGMITASCDSEILSQRMKDMLSDDQRFAHWKKNLNRAAEELCWENEKQKFIEIIKDAFES